MEDENQSLTENCRKYESAMETLNKEKQTLDKKCAQVRRGWGECFCVNLILGNDQELIQS